MSYSNYLLYVDIIVDHVTLRHNITIGYWSTSSRQQHSSPSRNTWKRSYCNDTTH